MFKLCYDTLKIIGRDVTPPPGLSAAQLADPRAAFPIEMLHRREPDPAKPGSMRKVPYKGRRVTDPEIINYRYLPALYEGEIPEGAPVIEKPDLAACCVRIMAVPAPVPPLDPAVALENYRCLKIRKVNADAGNRILALDPDWTLENHAQKQRNLTAEGVALIDERVPGPPAGPLAERSNEIRTTWTDIAAIRSASDAIEATIAEAEDEAAVDAAVAAWEAA